MKTFEEKFSAWVDGALKGEELAQFELELANVKDAELDKIAAHRIGDLCRTHGSAPELKNADFFNHQLMQQIEADLPKQEAQPQRAKYFWSLPKLALAGAFSLVVAFGLYHTMIPGGPEAGPQQTLAVGSMQVINVTGGDPTIVATTYKQDDVTVLWLDNLQYVPEKKPEPKKKVEPKKKAEPENRTEKY